MSGDDWMAVMFIVLGFFVLVGGMVLLDRDMSRQHEFRVECHRSGGMMRDTGCERGVKQ